MADTDTSDDAAEAKAQAKSNLNIVSGDGEEDAAEPKRKSKLLLIVGLVAVLLLGGGAAAWFLVLAPAGDSEEVVVAVEPEPLPPEVPDFVDVEWLVVQTRGGRAAFRNLSVLVSLEVEGNGFADAEVAGAMPKLRDAFLLALSEPPLVGGPSERIDADVVKARLGAAAEHVLGKPLVRDVLIRSILDAPA